jgi:holo-[acyl-carrier protein] synthase
MILGLGLDLVDTSEFEHRLDDQFFVRAVFSAHEISFCDGQPGARRRLQSYAGRYAAKEALIKAFDTARLTHPVQPPTFELSDLEIRGTRSGPPRFSLTPAIAEKMDILGVKRAHLSITHDGHSTAAVVILEG